MTRLEAHPLKRGPRLLPGRIEGKVRSRGSAPFVVERLIRLTWDRYRYSDRIGRTSSTLKNKIMRSGSPALWKLLIEAGILSMIVDKTTQPLDRFDLEIVFNDLRKWDMKP